MVQLTTGLWFFLNANNIPTETTILNSVWANLASDPTQCYPTDSSIQAEEEAQ